MSTSSVKPPGEVFIGFEAIIAQQRQIKMLAVALRKNEVPHAMLFTGEAGIGKKTTAITFAMAANCESPGPMASGVVFSDNGVQSTSNEDIRIPLENKNINPCGTCRPCRKIASEKHPDFHYIRPEGAYIKIEQIRTLCSALARKPHEASVRFVLLSDAHLMNAESGNALLKILEEPPENTIFILAAPQVADILSTIVSRCRHFRFNPIPEDQLEAYLIEKKGMSPENAMVVASLSGGSIGRALSIKNDKWAVVHRKRIIDRMEMIFRKSAGQDLYFAESLSRDKKTLAISLEIMKSWLRDLAVFQYCPDRIVNRDLQSRFAALSDTIDTNRLLDKISAIWQVERAIKGNANSRLAMESLVIKLSE